MIPIAIVLMCLRQLRYHSHTAEVLQLWMRTMESRLFSTMMLQVLPKNIDKGISGEDTKVLMVRMLDVSDGVAAGMEARLHPNGLSCRLRPRSCPQNNHRGKSSE